MGPTGRVISFEPQPHCYQRIQEAIADNQLSHVEAHNLGLSEEPGELDMFLLGGGTVLATMAIDDDVDGPNVRERIQDQNGSGGFDPDWQPRRQRRDQNRRVEGYELFVLKGLSETITNSRPVILAELQPRHLRRAGTDEDAYFRFFICCRYTGYAIGTRRSGLRGGSLLELPALRSLPNATSR